MWKRFISRSTAQQPSERRAPSSSRWISSKTRSSVIGPSSFKTNQYLNSSSNYYREWSKHKISCNPLPLQQPKASSSSRKISPAKIIPSNSHRRSSNSSTHNNNNNNNTRNGKLPFGMGIIAVIMIGGAVVAYIVTTEDDQEGNQLFYYNIYIRYYSYSLYCKNADHPIGLFRLLYSHYYTSSCCRILSKEEEVIDHRIFFHYLIK